MMRVAAERLRDNLFELGFDHVDCFARSQAGAVADAEDVRIDRKRLLAERGVEDDVRSLAADARQRLQFLASAWDFAAVVINQRLAQGDDILRLGVEQADRLDRVA
jgi:hypothetical protein